MTTTPKKPRKLINKKKKISPRVRRAQPWRQVSPLFDGGFYGSEEAMSASNPYGMRGWGPDWFNKEASRHHVNPRWVKEARWRDGRKGKDFEFDWAWGVPADKNKKARIEARPAFRKNAKKALKEFRKSAATDARLREQIKYRMRALHPRGGYTQADISKWMDMFKQHEKVLNILDGRAYRRRMIVPIYEEFFEERDRRKAIRRADYVEAKKNATRRMVYKHWKEKGKTDEERSVVFGRKKANEYIKELEKQGVYKEMKLPKRGPAKYIKDFIPD